MSEKPSPSGWWCFDCGYPSLNAKPGVPCRRCGGSAKRSWRLPWEHADGHAKAER